VRLAAERPARVRRRGGRRAGAEPAGLGRLALLRLRSLGVLGGDVDLRRLAQALLEGLDPLPDAAHHLGQPAGPEHDEDDHEHDEQLADAHPEHAGIIGEPARAGKLRSIARPGSASYTALPRMPTTLREAYERLLPLVEKPGRYLGNERGAIHKDPRTVRLRFALCFPEVYEIAQSHLGLQILYDALNRRREVAAERAYAPWPDLEALLRARGLPLVSLESHLPLADFHVLGFSLQYELTYTNLLTMLELGRVPLRAAARGPTHPLVIAGGPCAFNPEPLEPFLDGILLGDGEAAVGDICDRVLAWDGRDRGALLRALADIPGFYVPAFFAPRYHADGTIVEVVPLEPARPRVHKRVLVDLDRFAPPTDPIVPNVGVVHDRASVE